MNRRSEDAGEVPWPALVDLLTSVLITFMFFILVTTVAMSAMTMKAADDAGKKDKQGRAVSESEVVSDTIGTGSGALLEPTPGTLNAALTNPVSAPDGTSATLLPPPTRAPSVESEDPISETESQRLKSENELLKQQLAAMGASFAKSKEIKTVAEPTENALTLLFNPNEAGMVPMVEVSILKFVKQMQGTLGKGMRLQITASEPTGVSFSQARERALTRAMVVRNSLLENGIDPASVNFRYDGGAMFKSHNWVRLQALPATGAPQ